MRWLVLFVPLALGACGGSWPSGSYASAVTDADAAVLSPAIVDYLSATLPPGATVSVAPSGRGDPIAARLPADLERAGLSEAAGGQPVSYVAAPLGSGLLLRISTDNREGASRYFARTGTSIVAAGPLTVAQP